MKKLIFIFLTVAAALSARAQVTTVPYPLQEDSKDVMIYFHADQGDKGLIGSNASTALYAHTWATLSNGQQVGGPDWNAPYPDKFKLVYVSENLWSLYIGDIRTFYGVTSPTVTVKSIGFVFRNAGATKTGRGEGGADIVVPVLDSGLQIIMESSLSGSIVTPLSGEVTFTAFTTEAADISISVNGTEIASTSTPLKELAAVYTFPAPGDYTVVAKATADGVSVQTSSDYCYVKASEKEPYPGSYPQMGPVRNADGSVTFCLGAPDKESVILVGAWNDYAIENDQVMNYTDVDGLRYFWVTVSGLENDKMYGYYFIVDEQIAVGDPYARLVLDPWQDKYISNNVFPGLPAYPFDKIDGVPLAVYQGNINDYDWQVTDFKGVDPDDLIIYELLFRDFTGTEGRALGNGTVRKAIEKLPYLIDLGVNAVELLPIMEFNGNNSWGYNPNFYFAPDKAYGTPDDYKEFIDLCHQNGIAVILDMVFNQTDGLHPWYMMYMPGKNPFYNLDAPHAYSVLNDWNQGNDMLQIQFEDVLRYWLEEYRFDGYRFDLVKGLGDNTSYSNNGDAATNAYNQSRIDRMIQFQKVVKSVRPDAYFINEDLATAQEENAMAEYGQLNWANINDAGCQFAMGYATGSNLNRMYAPSDSRLWGSTVSYLESHDEQRLAYKQDQWGQPGVQGNVRVSMQRLGSAAAQMLMAPGAHMIWQFSEMGNAENTKTSTGGNNTDPKKVEWNLLNEPNHRGLVDSYSSLIAIRNKNKEMFDENASFSIACGVSNWVNGRTLVSKADGKELYTVVNPNISDDITVTISFEKDNNDAYYIMAQSYDANASFDAAAKTVSVPANCFVVVGSKTLLGANDMQIDRPARFGAYSSGGSIVVSAEAPVRIYALDGVLVGSLPGSGRLDVTPGIYLVSSGGETVKVAVR